MQRQIKRKPKNMTIAYEMGPQTSRLYNFTRDIQNECSLTLKDVMRLYYAVADPEYWIAEIPWKKKRQRYFIEISLCVAAVITGAVEVMNDPRYATPRERFEAIHRKFGLDPSRLKDYRVDGRRDYPALARALKKKRIPPEFAELEKQNEQKKNNTHGSL